MTDDLARLKAEVIARIVRDVAELPDRTSPDDWPDAMLVTEGELSNIVDNALPALLARIERVEGERDEAQMEIKRHFPVSNYNGLDIEQWKDRALAAERILALSGQHWRERWYGSEPQKGSWIYADRDPVAFIGPDATAHALTTAIVMAHNAALSSARAEGWKAGRDAAANWQPIATAPKDGPLILCSTPLRGGEHSCETWSPKALADELKRDAEGFYDKSPHLRSIPTHWMPLPANPATAILALEEPPHE